MDKCISESLLSGKKIKVTKQRVIVLDLIILKRFILLRKKKLCMILNNAINRHLKTHIIIDGYFKSRIK